MAKRAAASGTPALDMADTPAMVEESAVVPKNRRMVLLIDDHNKMLDELCDLTGLTVSAVVGLSIAREHRRNIHAASVRTWRRDRKAR